jgi:hypothetical protein
MAEDLAVCALKTVANQLTLNSWAWRTPAAAECCLGFLALPPRPRAGVVVKQARWWEASKVSHQDCQAGTEGLPAGVITGVVCSVGPWVRNRPADLDIFIFHVIGRISGSRPEIF